MKTFSARHINSLTRTRGSVLAILLAAFDPNHLNQGRFGTILGLMRYLLAIVLVFSALPAAQASACDMEMHKHDAMHQHDPVHAAKASEDAPDCCEADSDKIDHNCAQAAHCVPCLTIALGAGTDATSGFHALARHFDVNGDDAYRAPPRHPPFRPPIS